MICSFISIDCSQEGAALHYAAIYGQLLAVEWLIESAQADKEVKDKVS